MNNYVQKGRTLTVTLAAAVVSGQLVLLGNGKLPAVASGSYAANVEGEYNTAGVYDFPSAATGTAAIGDRAYLDSANGVVTVTANGNDPVGHFVLPKAAADTTARVRLWL